MYVMTNKVETKDTIERKEENVEVAEPKKVTFKAWVRNKETKELEELTVESTSVADLAKELRASGKYSFRTAAVPEKFDVAKDKWIKMNAKSIAYHTSKNGVDKKKKYARLIELIEPLSLEAKKEIYNILKLGEYDG